MRIVTHKSTDAPRSHTWIAAFYTPAVNGEKRAPMTFFGDTQELAIARAEDWLRQQKARESAEFLAEAERAAKRTTARKELNNAS